jgi:hypothetical protein
MEFIERMFKTVERPSASDSRKMADYIYHLEKRLQTSPNSESAKCQSDCRFASDMLHCGYCIRDDEALEEYKNYNDFYESD